MKLLVLGGTVFLGKHVVECALARGHKVTIFHRGIHGRSLFPEACRVLGDRDGGIGLLAGRKFDAVIDTSGYVPRNVRESARFLAGIAGLYIFVSSLAVYADRTSYGQDETAPVVSIEDGCVEKVAGETYGTRKVFCERAAEAAFPGRVLILRPGLIAGPDDPSDRFTYWPWRVAQGGVVLAPAPADQLVEFTDVRDLATFLVHAAGQGITGVMNVSGPTRDKMTMRVLLEICREVSRSDARFDWQDETALAERGVRPWIGMPLFAGGGASGFAGHSTGRAAAAGLRFRPVADTVRDTLAFARSRPVDHRWRAGYHGY